jgi:hypothetical protein
MKALSTTEEVHSVEVSYKHETTAIPKTLSSVLSTLVKKVACECDDDTGLLKLGEAPRPNWVYLVYGKPHHAKLLNTEKYLMKVSLVVSFEEVK